MCRSMCPSKTICDMFLLPNLSIHSCVYQSFHLHCLSCQCVSVFPSHLSTSLNMANVNIQSIVLPSTTLRGAWLTQSPKATAKEFPHVSPYFSRRLSFRIVQVGVADPHRTIAAGQASLSQPKNRWAAEFASWAFCRSSNLEKLNRVTYNVNICDMYFQKQNRALQYVKMLMLGAFWLNTMSS